MNVNEFIQRIKRRETPFYDRLYRAAFAVRHAEVGYVRGIHDALYHERSFRIAAWRSFWRAVYYQPLFRSRCARCGKNLHLTHSGQGIPLIEGNLTINIGENVTIYDRITLAGLTSGEHPTLTIGDNSVIGMPVAIMVGDEVTIGPNCIIGSALIADNPGHNLDYKRRFQRLVRVLIGKVKIGSYVYTGHRSMIIGNVTIGDGAIIGASSVVISDVPPFCVATGNPARLVKKLPFPREMIEILGEEEHRKYLEAKVEM
jgi:acetyltransferase-like isoleucine patch superfamily enzyme